MKQTNTIGRVVAAGKVDFIERELAALEPNQVRIHIRASAICGSDLHIFKDAHPFCSLPATIGHEFSGDVVEIGPAVTNVSVGDRVTVEPCETCGVCEACRSGQYSYCNAISFLYRTGSGAMADYLVADADHVFKLPASLTYEVGALLEPLAVATHAVRRAGIRIGQSVVIFGSGAIGILIAALARRTGATEVIVVDGNDYRLDLAEAFGATHTVNYRQENVAERIKVLYGGNGVDHTFECVGIQETFVQAMKLLRKGGLATIVGIFEDQEIQIPVNLFVSREIRVQGAQGYRWDFPIALKFAKELSLERLISHTMPMKKLELALKVATDRSQQSMKVVLVND